MNRLFLITICLLVPNSSLALGSIGLFSDASGNNCLLEDRSPGTLNVYVVLRTVVGSTGVQFAVTADDGFTGTFVSATPGPGFVDLGDPQDYAVGFPACYPGTVMVATFQYQGYGTSATCSSMSISPAPTSPVPGYVISLSCDFCCVDILSTTPLIVNYEANCPAWCITATETSTWGKVKALYGDYR